MNSSLTDVHAVIPTELVPQFYEWVAHAHSAGDRGYEAPQMAHVVDRNEPVAEYANFLDTSPKLIQTWWHKLSDVAREVIMFMAQNADERFTGTELAEECENLAGPSGAAGTFNWPSRHAKKLGFEGPWYWDTEVGAYFIPSPLAAALLSAVVPTDY